jgi:hypothetical protein
MRRALQVADSICSSRVQLSNVHCSLSLCGIAVVATLLLHAHTAQLQESKVYCCCGTVVRVASVRLYVIHQSHTNLSIPQRKYVPWTVEVSWE